MAKSESSPPARFDRRALLSAIAVVVAAALLMAAVATRLAPSGPRMAEGAAGGPSLLGPTCTYYPGGEVSIVAPGPGTIVVTATVGVRITHSLGTNDTALIVVDSERAGCAVTNHTAFVSVPDGLPSGTSYFETVPVLRPFPVASGATYTFYVNGRMTQGWDVGDSFDSASLVAVFYPR